MTRGQERRIGLGEDRVSCQSSMGRVRAATLLGEVCHRRLRHDISVKQVVHSHVFNWGKGQAVLRLVVPLLEQEPSRSPGRKSVASSV